MKDIKTLKKLEKLFKNDKTLPLAKGRNPVFGEGPEDASILAIGEAPGRHEDRLGRPFVGRSGKLLRKSFRQAGLDPKKDLYITNVVKHRPPENRDPTPEEITAYKPYLTKQIYLINPKIIITLGRFAMNYFLTDKMISKIHGQTHWITIDDKKRLLVPLYHPAAALRGTTVMNAFKKDIRKLKNALEYFDTMGEIKEDENLDQKLEEDANKPFSKQQMKLIN